MAVYSCWYIFRTMSALDSPCYLSRFSSRCLLPSALWLLSVFRFSNFPILLATFASLCFICSVEFPFGGSSPVLHYFLYAPPPFFVCLVTYIMMTVLLLSCSVCSFGPKESAQLAELPRQSKAQIFKLFNGTLIMRFVRVPARRVTHARTHKHTDRCTHRYTYPSRSLCHPQLIPLLFAPINLVA